MHKRRFKIGGSDRANMYSEEVDYEEDSSEFFGFLLGRGGTLYTFDDHGAGGSTFRCFSTNDSHDQQ